MNKKELINKIVQETGLSKNEVESLFVALSSTIVDSLAKGEKVKISGFGTFLLSKRPTRDGINPRNPQEKIIIPASITARFRPSKNFKRRLS